MGFFRFIRDVFAFPGNIAAMARAAKRSDEVLHMLHTLHGEVHVTRLEQRDLLKENMHQVQVSVREQATLLESIAAALETAGVQSTNTRTDLAEMIKYFISMDGHIVDMMRSLTVLEAKTEPLKTLTTVEDRTTVIANAFSVMLDRIKSLEVRMQETFSHICGSLDLLPHFNAILEKIPVIEDRASDMVRNTGISVKLLETINDRMNDTALSTGVTKDMITAVETHVSNMRNATEDIHNTSFHMAIENERENLLSLPKYQDAKRLNRHEKQICSQNGEDGIIAEIFRRIGTSNRIFAECGVSDGLECNTAHLLQKNWTGLWVESSKTFCASIAETFQEQIATKSLAVMQRFLTAENINNIFSEAGIPETFDLLSIDIDGNDYWIWKALDRYRPRVVVVEYNAQFPPEMHWVLEYDPMFRWDGTQYYGASLSALVALAEGKGYVLVGCELTGNNAFFVQKEYAEHFRDPFTSANHYEPPRYYMVHKRGHRRGFGPSAKTMS